MNFDETEKTEGEEVEFRTKSDCDETEDFKNRQYKIFQKN